MGNFNFFTDSQLHQELKKLQWIKSTINTHSEEDIYGILCVHWVAEVKVLTNNYGVLVQFRERIKKATIRQNKAFTNFELSVNIFLVK